VVPHDEYRPITVLSQSMNCLIGNTRVETEGFQSLVRFLHKHRSLCLCYLLIDMRVKDDFSYVVLIS
jgi:hypothetical protein